MSKGFIYLLKCVSDYETCYKIGFTKNKNINKRILNLQTGNQDKITHVDSFETNYGVILEKAIHNFYAHKNIRNEWFELDIQDVVNFPETCQKIEKNFDALKDNPYFLSSK